jgi:hypothetical protein
MENILYPECQILRFLKFMGSTVHFWLFRENLYEKSFLLGRLLNERQILEKTVISACATWLVLIYRTYP